MPDSQLSMMTAESGVPIVFPEAASRMVTCMVCCCWRVPPTLRASPVTVQVEEAWRGVRRVVGLALMRVERVGRRKGRRI